MARLNNFGIGGGGLSLQPEVSAQSLTRFVPEI
jgi:hypothetical protein